MNVLLAHGLARTPLSVRRLSRYLRTHGFHPQTFGYVAYLERYDRIVRRFRERLKILADQGPYAVVAHSLGGILTRAALGDAAFTPPHHIVMMGTPNNRSRMAEWATRFTPWGWLIGQAGRNLARPDFFASLPTPDLSYTIIAGTRGITQAWLPPFRGMPNDTLVAVDETRLRRGETLIELPISHTFMPSHRLVLPEVLEALRGSLPASHRPKP